MALEPERNSSRLPVWPPAGDCRAHLEQRALYAAGEKRDTHAAKLMQRFADHPCATWRQIELALSPVEITT
jgi:CRISPR-associated protein Csd1